MLKKTLTLASACAILLSPLLYTQYAFAKDTPTSSNYWWPERLDLSPLRKSTTSSTPYGKHFNYAKAFNQLDLNAVKNDLKQVMTTSQDWWPADFGHYGPLFIRMAWHAAGTYRVLDGHGGADGGMQRFAPLNSWPDNVNLDKARRLLWPIKQKYGQAISWGDLMVLAGNVAMESMGFKTLGFAGGRVDAFEPEEVNWGSEDKWLGRDRYSRRGKLKEPLAAAEMGLIYVNPEGPNGNPDPLEAAKAIRVTFARMAMNDEETVALIAGGHTFGKAHGAASPENLGPEPEAAGLEEQGLGWKNKYKTGKGADTITSGLEGAWTVSPATWTHNYLQNLFNFTWVQTKSPAGAIQWIPEEEAAAALVPDAHDSETRHAPIMFTTDLALKFDPDYKVIAQRFLDNPKDFEMAFAKAWFKLTHRDMGPRSRYLGSMAPKEEMIWQDPVPAVSHPLIDETDIRNIKLAVMKSGLKIPDLVKTAWAAASTYRSSDMRGGANGARLRLEPQKDWDINDPIKLNRVIGKLKAVQNRFNKILSGDKKISLADMIVLAGDAAVEQAAQLAGVNIEVPFIPGRTDASQAQTNVKSFSVLKPKADGFRNYFSPRNTRSAPELLVEKAEMLNLTVPEMTVLVGGMRMLDTNAGGEDFGVFTYRPGRLSNDFFVNLLDTNIKWKKSETQLGTFEGYDKEGKVKWRGTSVDLLFGANSELRAVAEVYASNDAKEKFVRDFVNAWVKVMQNDRFDLA